MSVSATYENDIRGSRDETKFRSDTEINFTFYFDLLVTMFFKRFFFSLYKIKGLSTVFSTGLENLLPFSSNLKLSSADSLRLEESKICCLGKVLSNFSLTADHSYINIYGRKQSAS